MAKIALDTNILVYALLEGTTDKGSLAGRLLERASFDGVIAAQALTELLAVTRRQRPELLADMMRWARGLAPAFVIASTDLTVLTTGGELALRHRLQIFDAVIVAAAAQAGADMLLSEDMQDGLRIEGVRIVNPFNPDNRAEIKALLA